MYFKLGSVFQCHIINEFISLPRCQKCGRDSEAPNYVGVYFRADKFLHQLKRPNSKGLNRWPLSLGSFQSLLLHENVVNEFIINNIQGVKFHQIAGIQGNVLNTLPCPPTYYKVEPLINTCFYPPAEEFELIECECGIFAQQKIIGDYKSPFEINQKIIQNHDLFSIVPGGFWVCAKKSVIDVLVQNKWTDDFEIGSRALPGMRIRDFGSTWYEDTLKQLRTSFPDSTIFE